jgi:hypothetical protein
MMRRCAQICTARYIHAALEWALHRVLHQLPLMMEDGSFRRLAVLG